MGADKKEFKGEIGTFGLTYFLSKAELDAMLLEMVRIVSDVWLKPIPHEEMYQAVTPEKFNAKCLAEFWRRLDERLVDEKDLTPVEWVPGEGWKKR